MGFGNSVVRTVIYEAKKKQNEDKKIWNNQKQLAERKHERAKSKLETYAKTGKQPTEKQMERINTDLDYQAKTPDEVRDTRKQKDMMKQVKYIESIGQTRYTCSKLFGDWVLYVGMNKKK